MTTEEYAVLNKFGEILIPRVRDEAIEQWDMVLDGRSKAPADIKLKEQLSQFTPEQVLLLQKVISQVVDTTLHHLLWTFEQEQSAQIIVTTEDKKKYDLAIISDGLAGELYGWIPKFSKQRYEPD